MVRNQMPLSKEDSDSARYLLAPKIERALVIRKPAVAGNRRGVAKQKQGSHEILFEP